MSSRLKGNILISCILLSVAYLRGQTPDIYIDIYNYKDTVVIIQNGQTLLQEHYYYVSQSDYNQLNSISESEDVRAILKKYPSYKSWLVKVEGQLQRMEDCFSLTAGQNRYHWYFPNSEHNVSFDSVLQKIYLHDSCPEVSRLIDSVSMEAYSKQDSLLEVYNTSYDPKENIEYGLRFFIQSVLEHSPYYIKVIFHGPVYALRPMRLNMKTDRFGTLQDLPPNYRKLPRF